MSAARKAVKHVLVIRGPLPQSVKGRFNGGAEIPPFSGKNRCSSSILIGAVLAQQKCKEMWLSFADLRDPALPGVTGDKKADRLHLWAF